jgi:hypothetical protein
MKFINRWAALVASAAFFLASPVSAQWQVPSGAFPLGKGSGTGFASILCTQAQIAIGQNAAAPICAALSGDITMTAGGVTAIGASKVTNSMLATMAANTTKCNATAGTTNPTDCTASTMRTNIGVVIGTNVQAWDTDLDCIAALSSTGQIKRTGTGTCSAGSVALSDLATGTQDTVIGYFGSTTASALAINNCANALTYSTATHTFGCNATAGTGTVTSVTPGAGLVSSTTASCSQSAITTSGTVSAAGCVNAQTGTSYAILDADRAKLVTATNAAAQAYTIAQAGAASNFQAGWYVDVANTSANVAGVVTITPTTSTINGAASYKIGPGMSARITSDGTNYVVSQVSGASAGSFGRFTGVAGAGSTIANGSYTDMVSITQGTYGTWFVHASAVIQCTSNSQVQFKIYDGTTTFASGQVTINGGSGNDYDNPSVSGIATPAGTLRLAANATTGNCSYKSNNSSQGKDTAITAIRLDSN